jgi:hypothetical protein
MEKLESVAVGYSSRSDVDRDERTLFAGGRGEDINVCLRYWYEYPWYKSPADGNIIENLIAASDRKYG